MKIRTWKSLISLVLAVSMVLSYMVVPVSAETTDPNVVEVSWTGSNYWSGSNYFGWALADSSKVKAAQWYGTNGAQYANWPKFTGTALIDGVEQTIKLLVPNDGSLHIELDNFQSAERTIVIPAGSEFALTALGTGGVECDGKLVFDRPYMVCLANGKAPVLGVQAVNENEKVTVTLGAYANWSGTNYVPFSLSPDTEPKLAGTSWWVRGSGGTDSTWSGVVGMGFLNGVKTRFQIAVLPTGELAVRGLTNWASMNATIVLPKDNVFSLVRSYNGTTAYGGQIQFAEDTVIILEAGKNPVICKHTDTTATREEPTCQKTGKETVTCDVCGHVVSTTVLEKLPHNWVNGECSYGCGTAMDPKEKLTVELNAYANWATDAYTFFTLSTTTQNKLDATSWYATTGTSNPYWAQLKGTANVNGDDQEITILMANNKQLLLGVVFSENTKVILSKDSVFSLVKAGNAGTAANGGQIQFAEDYVIVHNGSKPEICKHTNVTTETVEEATCQKTGLQIHTCAVCGRDMGETVLDKVPHNWVNGECTFDCGTAVAANEKVTVTLDKPANFAQGGYTYFIPTTATNDALDGTSWFASTGNFNNWTHLMGIANVDGVDKEISIRIASNHQLLLGVEFNETTKVLLSKDSVFYLVKAGSAGTDANGGQLQFAEDYVIVSSGGKVVICKHAETTTTREEPTCHSTGLETVKCSVCGRIESTTTLEKVPHNWVNGECTFDCGTAVAANEKVVVTLGDFNSWGDSGKIPFFVSDETKTLLGKTSWYKLGAGNSSQWATLTGKMLVDGVEQDVTITIASTGEVMLHMTAWTSKTAVIELPAENTYYLTNPTTGCTKDNGGQISFAEDYTIGIQNGTVRFLQEDYGMDLWFAGIGYKNAWNFRTTKAADQLGGVYSGKYWKVVGEADGEKVIAWLEVTGENSMSIYTQCFSPGVPAQTLVLKEGTLLIQTTNAGVNTAVAGVKAYRLNKTLSLVCEDGVWTSATQGGDNAAYVGGVAYDNIQDALGNVVSGMTINVCKNAEISRSVELENKALTLDLGGNTLSGETIATLGAGATLTIVSRGGSLEGQLVLAASGATINADCAIAVEMNGNDATINGGTVTLTDSATDGGDVGGKIYGNFTVASRVTKKNGIRYVILDGTEARSTYVTANAVRVKVTKISVRPSEAGLYYTTEVKFNKNVADMGVTYGVALSVVGQPKENFTEKVDGKYTSLWTAKNAATGANFSSSGNSCLVSGIFKEGIDVADNISRGEMNIFANGYVKLTVGGEEIVVMAENVNPVVYSMQAVMQAMDTNLKAALDAYNGTTELTGDAKKVFDFYGTWQSAMTGWSLPNLAAAYAKKPAA